jgi:hypothetical protein
MMAYVLIGGGGGELLVAVGAVGDVTDGRCCILGDVGYLLELVTHELVTLLSTAILFILLRF